MSKTKLDICNMALAILGQDYMSSLTEENQRAVLCNQYYDIVRQQLLRSHDWGWARAKDKLVLLREEEDGPEASTQVYQKPANCLFVIRLYNEGPKRWIDDREFKLEYDATIANEVIRSRMTEAYAEYVRDISDTTIFDSQFIAALAALLAHEIAMSLTGSTQLSQLAMQKYQLALDAARYSNKVEQLEDAVFQNPYLDSREK